MGEVAEATRRDNWAPTIILGLLGLLTLPIGIGLLLWIVAILMAPPIRRWFAFRSARKAGRQAPDASPTPAKYGWRHVSAGVGWTIGLVFVTIGLADALIQRSYAPDVVTGLVLALAGAFVLPPVTAAVRHRSGLFTPTFVPPIAFVVLLGLAHPLGLLVEPRGAARAELINQAIARADADLANRNVTGAKLRLEHFEGDAAANPRLAAILARVRSAEQAEAAARWAADADARNRAEIDAASEIAKRRAKEAEEAAARQVAKAPARTAGNEYLQRSEAMVLVQHALRDPASARYGRVLAYEQSGDFHYCGAVNARNGLGGYTGEQRFIAIPPAIVMIDDGSASFREGWQAACLDTSHAREVRF